MSRFLITYPTGTKEEVEQSDCDTLEAFVNAKFGSVDYAAHGVTVEMMVEGEVVEIDKPAQKKKK